MNLFTFENCKEKKTTTNKSWPRYYGFVNRIESRLHRRKLHWSQYLLLLLWLTLFDANGQVDNLFNSYIFELFISCLIHISGVKIHVSNGKINKNWIGSPTKCKWFIVALQRENDDRPVNIGEHSTRQVTLLRIKALQSLSLFYHISESSSALSTNLFSGLIFLTPWQLKPFHDGFFLLSILSLAWIQFIFIMMKTKVRFAGWLSNKRGHNPVFSTHNSLDHEQTNQIFTNEFSIAMQFLVSNCFSLAVFILTIDELSPLIVIVEPQRHLFSVKQLSTHTQLHFEVQLFCITFHVTGRLCFRLSQTLSVKFLSVHFSIHRKSIPLEI